MSELTSEEENKQLKMLLIEVLKTLNTLTTTRTNELEAADKVIAKINTLLKPGSPPHEEISQALSV